MMNYIKNQNAIEKMRVAGRMAAEVMEMIAPKVQEGITTEELDRQCHDYIVHTLKAYPAPLNYHGFPKSICTSINEVVCHGIPSSRTLKAGDILNIDITVQYQGYHGDMSCMFSVGPTTREAQQLIHVTQDALYLAIDAVGPGVDLKKIGRLIQSYAHAHRYSVVETFCGHGIGQLFHEPGFQVLHYDHPGQASFILKEGMTFTIEPMINLGKKHTKILKDGWTAVTRDGSLSAQWEHTLLVTGHGCEILTLRPHETARPSAAALAWQKKRS